jgi:Flagellar hook-length control protein FliK
MSIVINPTVPQVAALGVAATVVLQPGTVVAARVLQILGNDTVQIAIGGQSIDVLSQVPLQAGQTLQLAVSQGSDGTIRLAVVSPQGGAAAPQGPAGAATATAASDSVTLAPGASAGIAAPTTSAVVVSNNQLTPLEALAVSVAAQTAATQQTSLAPLFANLGVAAGLTGLPPQVQQAVTQLLAQRTSLDPGLSGDDIKQAFQSSGLFLEAALATGSASASGSTPDLKAALIVLRQILMTSLNGATATATTSAPPTAVVQQGTTQGPVVPEQATQPSIQGLPQPVTITVGPEPPTTASPALAPRLASELASPAVLLQGGTSPIPEGILDLGANAVISSASTPADAAARSVASSAALNLLQEAVQAGPLTAGNLSRLVFDDGLMLSLLPAVAGARVLNVDDAEFARTNVPPPPISGALPAAQPVLPATLVSNSPIETAMHRLLADTDGAIARQTLLQVASLPGQTDTTASRLDPTAPRWNFEIPFATPQGTAMAQFEISRDGSGSEVEAAKRVWRARFSLDVEPAGPVHAQVSLSGDRTSVRMWAERPATAEQLRAGVSQLSQALSRAELQPGDIVIRDGAPLQSASAPAGHFLDRAL